MYPPSDSSSANRSVLRTARFCEPLSGLSPSGETETPDSAYFCKCLFLSFIPTDMSEHLSARYLCLSRLFTSSLEHLNLKPPKLTLHWGRGPSQHLPAPHSVKLSREDNNNSIT
eukprot:scaffold5370_cov160-Skeletonema_marinoi.AAC.2